MAGDDPSMTVLRGLLLIRVEALCGLALEAEIVDGSALVHCNEHRLGNRLYLYPGLLLQYGISAPTYAVE